MRQEPKPLFTMQMATMEVVYDPIVLTRITQNDWSGRPLTPAEQDASEQFWAWYMGEEA